MGYFDDLKKKVIEECLFKYVDSDNGVYYKEMGFHLHEFSYSNFDNSYKAPAFTEPETGTLEQKKFVLLNGNGTKLTEELLKDAHFIDSQMITKALAFYFFRLVKSISSIKVTKLTNSDELRCKLDDLNVNDLDEAIMLIDLQYFSKISNNLLDGKIKCHENKGIFYRNTFAHFFPIFYVPQLNTEEIVGFNKNYSFCYSDLNIYLEDNKVKVDVKIGVQNEKYIKLLSF